MFDACHFETASYKQHFIIFCEFCGIIVDAVRSTKRKDSIVDLVLPLPQKQVEKDEISIAESLFGMGIVVSDVVVFVIYNDHCIYEPIDVDQTTSLEEIYCYCEDGMVRRR